MAKRRKSAPLAREEPKMKKRSLIWMTDSDGFKTLECRGYTSLAHNPEVVTAVDTIARLVGAMSIHLMQNTDRGDVRVVNELSRAVDINPNQYMTRSNFVSWIVKTLYLDGAGNTVVYPRTSRGYLRELIPIPPAYTASSASARTRKPPTGARSMATPSMGTRQSPV